MLDTFTVWCLLPVLRRPGMTSGELWTATVIVLSDVLLQKHAGRKDPLAPMRVCNLWEFACVHGNDPVLIMTITMHIPLMTTPAAKWLFGLRFYNYSVWLRLFFFVSYFFLSNIYLKSEAYNLSALWLIWAPQNVDHPSSNKMISWLFV